MNFNPQNEQGLLGLVSALKQGMDPSAAYSIYQNIQANQAQQVAQRQERLGGLAQLLMGAAQSGMPYAGAEALADAAPGPMGPAVENMMQALYPTADDRPDTNYLGRELSGPMGSRNVAGNPYANTSLPAPDEAALGIGGQATSPTFMPPQMAPMEQLQMAAAQQELEQQAAAQQAGQASALAGLEAAAVTAKSEGKTVGELMRDVIAASPENAMYLQQDPAGVREVLTRVFEAEEINTTPWHAMLGL